MQGGGTTDGRRADLLDAARRWRAQDPDPGTRAELDELLAGRSAESTERLEAAFGSRLAFGTAGIRGTLGPGPAHMNRLVSRQVAAGIARVCLEDVPRAAARGVVVGCDARHGSEAFSAEITSVLLDHGLDVHRIDGVSPTPLAAFAVRRLSAAAGIVVTASHNPADDNGIKVYWSDGAQVTPPLDGRIASRIEEAAAHGCAPAAQPDDLGALHHLGAVEDDSPLVRAYLEEVAAAVPARGGDTPVIAYTSLHGVGGDLLELALSRTGFERVHAVGSQRRPDPAFPTVAFPNPEEPGAMDEVLDLAVATGADMALANDPDADRLALAAPRPDRTWQVLTGDELGVLLAVHLLGATEGIADRSVATTVVSSRLLGAVARAHGVHFAETLTGFKWLCRPALQNPGWHQVIIYEEALGYGIGPSSRDKDGIAAAVVAADMFRALNARDRTVFDVLDELALRHGAHVTLNGSVRTGDPGHRVDPAALLARVADRPPEALGAIEVASSDRPAHDVLRIWLQDDTRVVLRPSGTEAKFKYYCEAVEAVSPGEAPEAARSRASRRLEAVAADLGLLLR